MSSSNSPCAACKFLRRKCTQECVFAPYFPPDQPQRFANVHKVFGASNVAKLLNELNAAQREDVVNSLAYEAEARLRDPVYGCVGLISLLQQRLKQVQTDLYTAKKELATYVGPSALMPMIQPSYANPASTSAVNVMQQQYNMGPMMGIPTGVVAGPSHGGGGTQLVIRDAQQQQQQLIESQQLAALTVKDEQEMMRNWEQQQQQQQQQFMRFNGSSDLYEGTMVVGGDGGEFNQVGSASAATSPSLALGATTFDHNGYNHIQTQQPQQGAESLGQLLLLQQPVTTQQQPGMGEVAQGIPHHENNQQQQQGSISHQHLLHHHEHNQQQQQAGSE
ncbi:hypothetical protein BVRB_8g194110 [Beta vulgaris subsp. vulgaris]|uniref:LOB domain-containing protein 36 n=1 Tax=Beta vulgaris subsp. vulgaris TaxID=3555 RepID=UPI00053F3D4E|nr:LOB domain-containing protein 36 [Beta vulgaris subsp. vulgaris]KMT02828.1 hypothetical protein BVRB_8g194110 [Beta vulgaris subsp. vulgaris]